MRKSKSNNKEKIREKKDKDYTSIISEVTGRWEKDTTQYYEIDNNNK